MASMQLFDISAFTDVGTIRKSNQDHILVNDQIANTGCINLADINECKCFVADGVGGNLGGEEASYYILSEIKKIENFNRSQLRENLSNINLRLIEKSSSTATLNGAASTLSGLITNNNNLEIVHAGDSEIWLLRDNMFFKLTTDHVLNDEEMNSPITSYFGGYEDNLTINFNENLDYLEKDDTILICSDGLFKSLTRKTVKSILKKEQPLSSKSKEILDKCLSEGAEDNISVIIIHLKNNKNA